MPCVAGALRVHGGPQRGEGYRAAAGRRGRRESHRERDGGRARHVRPGPEEEGEAFLLSMFPGLERRLLNGKVVDFVDVFLLIY